MQKVDGRIMLAAKLVCWNVKGSSVVIDTTDLTMLRTRSTKGRKLRSRNREKGGVKKARWTMD